MFRLAIYGLVFLMFSACSRGSKQEADAATAQERLFTFQGTPQVVKIKGEALQQVKEWKEFAQLERSFDVMFQASTNEDLVLAIDGILESEGLVNGANAPELYKTMKIKSRQKVMRTFLLKTKAGLANNRDVTEGVKEMLVAYNALRNQLNSIANNQLDTKLILNETP